MPALADHHGDPETDEFDVDLWLDGHMPGGAGHHEEPAADGLEVDLRLDEHGRATLPVTFMVHHAGQMLSVGRATHVLVADGDPTALPEALRLAADALPSAVESTATDHPTANLVEQLVAARHRFALAGDAAAADLADLLADNVVWHVPGTSPVAGDFHGRGEVMQHLAAQHARTGGTYRIHSLGMLVDQRQVVHFAAVTADLGGVEHRWETADVYLTGADHIAEAWILPLDQGEHDRIWSRSPLAA